MCVYVCVCVFVRACVYVCVLTSESVEGMSLALEGVDDVYGSDSLSLGMFGVGDSITDDILKEDLQNSMT